jgi:hypothetical protein
MCFGNLAATLRPMASFERRLMDTWKLTVQTPQMLRCALHWPMPVCDAVVLLWWPLQSRHLCLVVRSVSLSVRSLILLRPQGKHLSSVANTDDR